jgi:hypothetical protein
MVVSSVTSDNPNFWPHRTSFTVPANTIDTLGVGWLPMIAGEDSALFTFTADDQIVTHTVRVRGNTVETVDVKALPVAFALGRTQPNPFASSALIPFALPHEAEVTLEVFDLQGKKVATLVRGRMSGGLHTAVFRPTDDGGATGVYFVRMRAEAFESTQKIVHFVR